MLHYARIVHSPRLQRVRDCLEKYGTMTTRDIIEIARVCAVNSCIAELKAQGYQITCKQIKRGVFQYTLNGGN